MTRYRFIATWVDQSGNNHKISASITGDNWMDALYRLVTWLKSNKPTYHYLAGWQRVTPIED